MTKKKSSMAIKPEGGLGLNGPAIKKNNFLFAASLKHLKNIILEGWTILPSNGGFGFPAQPRRRQQGKIYLYMTPLHTSVDRQSKGGS